MYNYIQYKSDINHISLLNTSECQLWGWYEHLSYTKAVIYFSALGVDMPQSKISTMIKLKIHPRLSKIHWIFENNINVARNYSKFAKWIQKLGGIEILCRYHITLQMERTTPLSSNSMHPSRADAHTIFACFSSCTRTHRCCTPANPSISPPSIAMRVEYCLSWVELSWVNIGARLRALFELSWVLFELSWVSIGARLRALFELSWVLFELS